MTREDEPKEPPTEEGGSETSPEAPTEPASPLGPGPQPPPPAPAEPDWQDLYLRARAELENYRMRMERDRATQAQYASESVIRKLIDPVESLDRAIDDLDGLVREAPDSIRGPLARSLDGLKALRRQVHALLDSEGVLRVGETGVPFDPSLHEALVTVPSDTHPEGTIAQLIQPGY